VTKFVKVGLLSSGDEREVSNKDGLEFEELFRPPPLKVKDGTGTSGKSTRPPKSASGTSGI
jgi:hypothetical protein